ncbi:MAG TPA: DUF2807 domain-containing protein [Mucilaginibacter sp.]|jgi:hypothetical protein
MKTIILTLAITLATVVGTSHSTYAATGNSTQVSTILTDVTSISKIEVHGNVQVYISSGTADQVKVYNNYYAESPLVQNENGILRITNYAAQKLTVWVTASQLQNISAYDNAVVKSFGKLSAIDLDIKLFGNAYAKLNLDTYSTKLDLKGKAKADLSGSVTEASMRYDRSAFLNTTELSASHLTEIINYGHKPHFHHFDHHSELASL